MGVVASSRCVAGSVTLSTRLDPDERVDQRVAGVGGRADTETSADDVAPVTPSLLASGLLSIPASIDNKVSRKAFSAEKGSESVDVGVLVAGFAALGV